MSADAPEGDEELERRRARARALATAADERAGGQDEEPDEPRSMLAAAAPAILLIAVAATLAAVAIAKPEPPESDSAIATATPAVAITPARTEPALDQPRSALETTIPTPAAIRDARKYAATRGKDVSFAVVGTDGKMKGEAMDQRYVSASIVKSMLLVAELRRLDAEDAPIDSETESLLTAMITYSDNEAADAIYDRVGDDGLGEVGKLYGMKRLKLGGYWASTYLTAGDMARMFSDLERPIPAEYREFALGLLGSIIPDQSWGIAAAAKNSGEPWQVRFKGGWRPTDLGWLAHQAAELRSGDEKLSIAVLTDGQPDFAYATETVEGVAMRLLADDEPQEEKGSAKRRARGDG